MSRITILLAMGSFCACCSGAELTVSTSFGNLVGQKVRQSCDQFLGIPYAKPPIGALRFAAPAVWDEQYPETGREAKKYGAVCPQPTGLNQSEDCLFLNLWRPQGTQSGDGLTTMVWIHGGAFAFGAGSSAWPGLFPANMYTGCKWSSKHSVIIATMNYRLGPLGFTTFEEGRERSGNFGIKDQRMALTWLQRELHTFGGDPSKVTIFGESAGGMSVFHHLASPLSKGLFRSAISESGFPTADEWKYRQEFTRDFATRLNCTDAGALLECLRSKDVKDIVSKGYYGNPVTSPMWNPVIDGVDMPYHPLRAFHTQRTNGGPLMAGTNTHEGNLFVWLWYEHGMNQSKYEEFVQEVFNGGHDPILKLSTSDMATVVSAYESEPGSTKNDRRASASAVVTDSTFLCGTQVAAQAYSASEDTFLYRFNHRSNCRLPLVKAIPGIYHSAEMIYVWDDPTYENCVFGPKEQELASRMQGMWTNFAKNSNPTTSTENFPQYHNSSRSGLVLQVNGDVVETDYRSSSCKLWQDMEFDKLLRLRPTETLLV